MKIDNVKVYDLEESIVASGLPKMAEYDADDFDEKCTFLEIARCDEYDTIHGNPHFKRMAKLADTPIGSGHSNALSGILVSMNITATVKWWEQFQRYHFKQIVSSMSTMHRLRQMMQDGTIRFNKNTDTTVIDAFMSMSHDESVTDEQLAYSCPMGLELTARITTNYLALKTIYNQRHNHRLTEWIDFCKEIETLPYAQELILKK